MQAALIGLGYWGKNYLRLLLDNKKVNLLMVGDVSNDALSRLEIPPGIIKTNVLEDIYIKSMRKLIRQRMEISSWSQNIRRKRSFG